MSITLDIVMYFKEPLTRNQILSADKIKIIFMNIEDLCKTHEEFHKMLREVSEEKFQQRKVSKPFMQYKDKFSQYAEYLVGIDESLDILDEIMESDSHEYKTVREIISNGESQASRFKFKLQELIKVPMQRILRYPLIVERLMKVSKKEHPDYIDLQKVKEDLDDLSQYINQTKADMDQTVKPVKDLTKIVSLSSDIRVKSLPDLNTLGRLLLDICITKWVEGNNSYKHSEQRDIRVLVFNMHVIVLQLNRNIVTHTKNIEKLIWESKIEKINWVSPTIEIKPRTGMARFALNHRDSHSISLRTLNQGMKIESKNENDLKEFMRAIIEAKKLLDAGIDKNKKLQFQLTDIPKPPGVLPQCSRIKCRKLLQGLKMQGYQSVTNPKHFVHGACLDFVMNQNDEMEAAPDVPNRNRRSQANSRRIPPSPNRPISQRRSSNLSSPSGSISAVSLRRHGTHTSSVATPNFVEYPTRQFPLPSFNDRVSQSQNNTYTIDPNQFEDLRGNNYI